MALCMVAAAGCGGKDSADGAGSSAEQPSVSDGEGVGTVGTDAPASGGNVENGADGQATATGAKTNGTDGSTADADEENPQEVTITLRIVDGAETGNLILAGDGPGEVYTLSVDGKDIFIDGALSNASVLEDGMLAEIRFNGIVLETYPAQLCDVQAVSVYSRGTEQNPLGAYYDLCGLYLQVLNDLWDVDSGLNEGASYVSVDLSAAPGDLSEGEKQAIAWIFASAHDVMPLTLNFEELAGQGYLSVYGEFDDWYEWTDGVLFSITPKESEDLEVYSLPVLKFNAEKWRSPLGAYCFFDCKAVWSEGGSWGGYSVGAEMIS